MRCTLTDFTNEEKEEMAKKPKLPSPKAMVVLGMMAAMTGDTRPRSQARYVPPTKDQVNEAAIEAFGRHCLTHPPCRKLAEGELAKENFGRLPEGLCRRGKRLYERVRKDLHQ